MMWIQQNWALVVSVAVPAFAVMKWATGMAGKLLAELMKFSTAQGEMTASVDAIKGDVASIRASVAQVSLDIANVRERSDGGDSDIRKKLVEHETRLKAVE